MSDYFDKGACVERFKGYLRVPSVHPDPPYHLVRDYLKEQADYWGLDLKVHEFVPQKLIFVLTLEGEDPTLPSIALYSHSDVVPVVEE
jgi:aminoacylase